MDRKEILLPEERYESAPQEDLTLNINLEGRQNLLTNDDRDIILDVNELYNTERNDSISYKIYGKMKMVFRNIYSGFTEYHHLTERLALSGDGSDFNFEGFLPYDEFAFLRRDMVREVIIVPDLSSLSGFTGFSVTITGQTGLTSDSTILSTTGSIEHNPITTLNAPDFNWNLYLSYVYSGDTQYPLMYTLSGNTLPLSFVSGDGIPFRIEQNGNNYKLISPVEHGMSQGEFIILDGNLYYINTVGDEYFDSEKYVINILSSQIPTGVTTFSNLSVTGKRCIDNTNVNNTTSQYYVHILKTITTVDNYIIEKAGFEQSIWTNERKLLYQNINQEYDALVERNRMETILYEMRDPFILSGMTNNLNYTPTDIHLTIIFRNGNGYFNYPPKVGYKFNFHNSWVDEQFNQTTSNESSISGTTFTKAQTGFTNPFTFISGNTLPTGTTLTGAFVEYNPMEMTERVISESFHKLTNPKISGNTIFDYHQDDPLYYSGVTSGNTVGIYYQPHYRIKLRELSPYIETSDTPDIDNMPQNAKYYPDEKLWKWRDLYDQGYIDDLGYGVNHPFINGIHYIKSDINFYLRNEQIFTNKSKGIASFNSKFKNNGSYYIDC